MNKPKEELTAIAKELERRCEASLRAEKFPPKVFASHIDLGERMVLTSPRANYDLFSKDAPVPEAPTLYRYEFLRHEERHAFWDKGYTDCVFAPAWIYRLMETLK
jgi:hypothetical protein